MYSEHEILESNIIETLIRENLPEGINVQVPIYELVTTKNADNTCKMAVFLIIYSGESIPITRDDADAYRQITEETISNVLTLRTNRIGRKGMQCNEIKNDSKKTNIHFH